MKLPLLVAGLLVIALAGCNDSPQPPAPVDQVPTSLVATARSGTEFVVHPDRVICGPSEDDPTVRTVQASGRAGMQFFELEVVPHDAPATYAIPVSAESQPGPAKVSLTLGDADHFVSTDVEISPKSGKTAGTLEVLEATCEPARLRLRISSVLGSQYAKGEPLTVEGGVDLAEEAPPGGIPNELSFYGGSYDGSSIVPTGQLACRPSRSDPAIDTIRLRVSSSHEDLFELEVAPVDEATTYELPVARERFWLRYTSELEVAATDTKAGRRLEPGQVEVLEASCDPIVLRFRIDGALGNTGGGATRRHLQVLGGLSLPQP